MAIPITLSIQFKCGHAETKDLTSTPAGKRKAKARVCRPRATNPTNCVLANRESQK